MATPLNTNGFSLISGNNASGIVSQLSMNLAREVAMSGYGELGKQDVGWAVTRAVDIARTVQSFAAIPMVDEAKHSSFAFFREAMAQSAQTQTSDLLKQVESGNMERAELNKIINGQSYTGFYADAVSGQQAVAPLLANTPNSPEALLDFSTVNFNDNQSVTEYLNRIREYSSTINLRNNIDLNAAAMQSEEYELLILMHTENKEAYGQYIQQFETQIQQNFQKELTSLQNNVKSMGYTGDVKDLKALEIFKNTQSGANASQVQQLIDATNGKINQVDRYILARIHNGDIDMQKILTTGEFNGVKLDEKSLSAFKALNIYANSDQITTNFHNETLAKIGFKSSMQNVDLNNLKHVTARVKEFEDALTKAGYGAINGKALSKLSIKEMREIDLSKISDPNALNAMKQYISLRDHKETLSQAKNMMANFRMRMVNLARKALGDSDLSQGIGQIQSGYHNAQLALKVWNRYGAPVAKKIFKFFNKTTLKLIKHMPAPIRNAYFKNLKFIRTIAGKARELWGRVASAPRKAAQKIASKATQALTKKSTSVAARQVAKHATRVARSTERKLILKAGQKVGEAIRHVAHLATSGAIGTTGAGAAAVTTTTAATATTVAAGATTVAAGATTTAAGVTTVGATAGTGGIAAIPIAAAAVVLIIIILICIAIYFLGGAIQVIASTPLALEDTLFGKIINFFANFKWPWQATEADKQNIINFTIFQLQEEQRLSLDLKHQVGKDEYGNDTGFYGGAYPYTSDINVFETVDSGDIKWGNYLAVGHKNEEQFKKYADKTYIFLGTDKNGVTKPINEYNNVKLVISMAHAFTYPIETKEHLSNFSLYATGLWKYLNDIQVQAKMNFCENGACNNRRTVFTYYCYATPDESGFDEILSTGRVKKLTKYEIKNGINLTMGEDSKLYVVDGDVYPYAAEGCRYYTYNPLAQTKTAYDSKTHAKIGEVGYSSAIQNVYKIDLARYNTKMGKDYCKSCNKTADCQHSKFVRSTGCIDEDGDTVYYKIKPNICKECAENNENTDYTDILNHTVFCSSANGCNNTKNVTVYTKRVRAECPQTYMTLPTLEGIKSVKVVNKTPLELREYEREISELERDNPSGAMNTEEEKYHRINHDTIEYNQCQGHKTEVFCLGTTSSSLTLVTGYSTYGGGTEMKCVSPKTETITHYSTNKCCDKCVPFYGAPYSTWQSLSHGGAVSFLSWQKQLKTYYVCPGTTDHGIFSIFDNKCNNYQTYVAEVCNGYDQHVHTKKTFCQGHVKCTFTLDAYKGLGMSSHKGCPGHTLKYCTGHVEYVFTKTTIASDSEAIYNMDWEYEVHSEFLWIPVHNVYSPLVSPGKSKTNGKQMISLARKDWAGWNENNRELMLGVFTDDWYLKYGYGIKDFVGATISSTEKQSYLDEFNITNASTTEALMKNLTFAFDSIGQVSYYPGDRAYYAEYDSRNKFGEVAEAIIDSRDYQLASHGLDYKYYADWVYRSTHENDSKPALTDNYELCNQVVNSYTKPGTPIVCKNNGGKSGILIGVKNGIVTYIGLSDTGWATVIESSETWFTSSTVQS